MLWPGQGVVLNNNVKKGHFTRKRKKRNKSDSISNSEKWFKEPNNKEEETVNEFLRVRVKDKATPEIKVWRLINPHKKVIKTAKELRQNKANPKVRNVLVKKKNIYQKNNRVKSSKVKKDKEKIWVRPIWMNLIDTITDILKNKIDLI